jgi:hypothetical protein
VKTILKTYDTILNVFSLVVAVVAIYLHPKLKQLFACLKLHNNTTNGAGSAQINIAVLCK